MTPEQLAKVKELVSLLTNGKNNASSWSLPAMTQSSSSQRVGNTSEPYQTAKSSSKDRTRTNCLYGCGRTHANSLSGFVPTFLSIKGYPEKCPEVIVVRKVIRRNGRLERFLGIYDVLGAD